MNIGTQVDAPFSPEQVATLNKFQRGGWFHPFTCGLRAEHPGEWPNQDEGVLIAAAAGWFCPVASCDYTQTWAHGFMADPEFVDANDRRHKEMWGSFAAADGSALDDNWP